MQPEYTTMNPSIHIILQNSGNAESKAVRMASMLNDNIKATNTNLENLAEHQRSLEQGAVPVGTVPFVRSAMKLAGLVEPPNLSYPLGGESYTKRQIWKDTAEGALNMTGSRFIKPASTKAFTGFVLNSDTGVSSLSSYDKIQYDALLALMPDAEVWVSELVQWVSEYRYYVVNSKIIGYARYDQDESDNVPQPDIEIVKQCISDLSIEHPYALDMGILASGESALVEVNDAWAIGLYSGAMKPLDYVHFLSSRWAYLIGKAHA